VPSVLVWEIGQCFSRSAAVHVALSIYQFEQGQVTLKIKFTSRNGLQVIFCINFFDLHISFKRLGHLLLTKMFTTLNGRGPQKELPYERSCFFTDYKKSTISRGLRNWPAISNIQVLKIWCHFGKRCKGLLRSEELRTKWNEASSKETKKSVKNEKGDKNHSPLFPIIGKQHVKEHKMRKNEVSVPLPCLSSCPPKKFGLTSLDCLRN